MTRFPCDHQATIMNNPVDQSRFRLFQVRSDTIFRLLSYIALHLIVILDPLVEDLQNLGHHGWHGFRASTRTNRPCFTQGLC